MYYLYLIEYSIESKVLYRLGITDVPDAYTFIDTTSKAIFDKFKTIPRTRLLKYIEVPISKGIVTRLKQLLGKYKYVPKERFPGSQELYLLSKINAKNVFNNVLDVVNMEYKLHRLDVATLPNVFLCQEEIEVNNSLLELYTYELDILYKFSI